MKQRDFFQSLVAGVRERLPEELRQFRARRLGSLSQFHYGQTRIHYEVWFHGSIGQLELALHCEESPERNDALLAFFDERFLAIRLELGQHVELERWTPSWVRIYETLPYSGSVTEALLAEATRRFSLMIAVLQPLVDQFLEKPSMSTGKRPVGKKSPKRAPAAASSEQG
jgi:hypothetical protein